MPTQNIPSRPLPALAVLVVLGVVTVACGAADGDAMVNDDGHDDEQENEREAEAHGPVGADCRTIRSDTGYTRGAPYAIRVVNVDGHPVELATASVYTRMQRDAAAAGVALRIVSGFRTNGEQIRLYNAYLAGTGNLAARPGYSNHQSGHALDLNTRAAGVYTWLNNNGARYGFRRTVPSEAWHWEYWGDASGDVCGSPGAAAPSAPTPGNELRALVPHKLGYWQVASDGAVFSYGDATYGGGANGVARAAIVSAAASSSAGYWMTAVDGAIFSFGGAPYLGGASTIPHRPIVGMAASPTTLGYWLTSDDGAIYAFGAVGYHGGANEVPHAPIAAIAATRSGGGYRLVATDGAIYAFGNASYRGGANVFPHRPITSMAASRAADGYWLVADDGAVFTFGDAPFLGGANAFPHAPVVAIAGTDTGNGYWLMASDGAVYSFGDAPYRGGANVK